MPQWFASKNEKTILLYGFLAVKTLIVIITTLLLYIRSIDIEKVDRIEDNIEKILVKIDADTEKISSSASVEREKIKERLRYVETKLASIDK
jgi:hypothetical protein